MAGLEGQILGSYEVLTKLGQGGMGAVYKARDTRLQRFVAIKVLPAQLATDEEFVHRFQREAIAAAQFCHSNLVQVFDIGESGDVHFIIMELVEGESLGHRLERKGRMAPREAVAVTIYIGQALAYAWNKAKLIHRDIKPANIFLSKDGEVKLGDLGLAKSLQDAASGLTLSGTIMGTPHYMSPEQGRGDKQLDFRSDIYSLGCVLYHMLTGEPPYQGDSTATLIYKHVHEAPRPLREVVPDCPEDLVEAVDWMMAKKPEDRPQTYEELLGELAAVRHALLHAPVAAPKPAAQTPPASVTSHAPVTMAQKKAPAASEPKSPSFGLIMTGTVVASALVLGLFIWSPWSSKPKPAAPAPPAATQQRGVTQPPPPAPVSVTANTFTTEVAALPAEQQVQRVLAKLKELNPAFDPAAANEQHRIENGTVTMLSLLSFGLRDISPLRALPELRDLSLTGTLTPSGNIKDKGALKDLAPLAGMKIEKLSIRANQVSDLAPLKGMPLSELSCEFNSEIFDLTPLAGLPLNRLFCTMTKVSDLSPLKNTGLSHLIIENTPVTNLASIAHLKLVRLSMRWAPVRDFSSLRNMPLNSLMCDEKPALEPGNLAILKAIPTLKNINNMAPAEFWMRAGGDKPSATDEAEWRNAINLLPLIDPQKDAVYGQWKMESGECVSDGGGDNSRGSARLQTPYHPPEEYDYRITFTRRGGTDAVMQFLTKESLNIRWVIGADGGRVLGFEHAGGSKHWSANPTTVRMNAALPAGTRHTSVIQVRKNGLTAFLDGKIVTRWPTDYSDFIRSPGWGLRDELALGLGSWQSPTVFNSAEVLEVTGRGKFTRPDDPAAKAAAEKRSRVTGSTADSFVREIAALPAEEQVKRVVAKLKELNPGYDGKEFHRIKDGRVDTFAPLSEEIATIAPVAALKSLEFFGCGATAVVNSVRVKLSDLSPLKGLPLKILQCPHTSVRDLSPLQGMPLTTFFCNGSLVSDLSSLQGMKLLLLNCQDTEVRDLSVLRDMPLRLLFCDPAIASTEANRAVLRSIKTLEKINNIPVAEFWKPAAAVKPEIKSLFNGRNLTGWRPRDTTKKNEWNVRSGTLVSAKAGADLVTEERFTDFLFHCEFKLAAGANSGVHLRGRYEIQLQDDHGKPATEQTSGGIYKLIAPAVNAIKAPGTWQTLDAAIVGHRVQVILNGKKVIENGLLSKPTIGALDQNIDQPGSLLLQSFMGQVEFRNLLLMPLNPGVNLQTLTFPAGWPTPRHN